MKHKINRKSCDIGENSRVLTRNGFLLLTEAESDAIYGFPIVLKLNEILFVQIRHKIVNAVGFRWFYQ